MKLKRFGKIRKLTHKNIRPYGCIIDSKFLKDDGRGDKFGVLLKERSSGWRIGYLVLRKRRIERLESHPGSLETFEPVSGKAVIIFAGRRSPRRRKLFLLDRPVCLKKKVKTIYSSMLKPIIFCIIMCVCGLAFAREWPEGEEAASHDYVGSRSIIISDEVREEERSLEMSHLFEDAALLGQAGREWSLKAASAPDVYRPKPGGKRMVDEVWGF